MGGVDEARERELVRRGRKFRRRKCGTILFLSLAALNLWVPRGKTWIRSSEWLERCTVRKSYIRRAAACTRFVSFNRGVRGGKRMACDPGRYLFDDHGRTGK